MFRHLLLFPTSADPSDVNEVVTRLAGALRQGSGFRSVTTSVDALMGPGAMTGEVGRIVEADFETLDDALAVLDSDGFQEVAAAVEALGPTIFVYELGDI